MRIKLRTTMAGPNGSYNAGSVVEFDDATAKTLLDGGFAETASVEPAAVPIDADDAEPAPKPRKGKSVPVGGEKADEVAKE